MIAIDENGDFVLIDGKLTETSVPQQQNYISEVRCLQDTYEPDPGFGRNPLTWSLSQNPSERMRNLRIIKS